VNSGSGLIETIGYIVFVRLHFVKRFVESS